VWGGFSQRSKAGSQYLEPFHSQQTHFTGYAPNFQSHLRRHHLLCKSISLPLGRPSPEPWIINGSRNAEPFEILVFASLSFRTRIVDPKGSSDFSSANWLAGTEVNQVHGSGNLYPLFTSLPYHECLGHSRAGVRVRPGVMKYQRLP